MSEARAVVLHVWSRWRSVALVFALLMSGGGAIYAGMSAWRAQAADAAIAALAAGRDVEVDASAPPALLAARIAFLTRRDEFDRARALLEPLEVSGKSALGAAAHYDLANALLRRAFALLERGQLEPAGPFVELARRSYRRALQLDPDFWDAKYNLDVASRLVRDNPRLEHSGGDELPADPKKIWTDIPGAPKGLP